jgi:sugar lactone lactonase YvrE
VAVDNEGNVYVADSYNNTIRKVTSSGVVTTLAGSYSSSGTNDGTGSAARFYHPYGVAADSAGNIYVADAANQTVRVVTSAGVVTTLAGWPGISGTNDGVGATARFNDPRGVTVDSSGNVYVADWQNHLIRRVTSAGEVTTIAGSAGIQGCADGAGTAAQFMFPTGLTVDGETNVFIADTYNHTIRKLTSVGVVTTLAGSLIQAGSVDSTGSAARLYYPVSVAFDNTGIMYVGDMSNETIRKVTIGGGVTTLAGNVRVSGTNDGIGGAALFDWPSGVAVDRGGTLYVADMYNHTIRKMTSEGVVTTLAGLGGVSGSANGTGSAARFYWPFAVALDGSDNLIVADAGNDTIRKVTTNGVVTTLAGLAGVLGTNNGIGFAARFNRPSGVAVDSAGNIFVGDYGNHTIRKVTTTGVVTTLAGSGGHPGAADGTGGAARFYLPNMVAVDSAGNVYVADTGNHTIRKVTSGGVVTTIGGAPRVAGGADGIGGAANFSSPYGVAVDSTGRVYVADSTTPDIEVLENDRFSPQFGFRVL